MRINLHSFSLTQKGASMDQESYRKAEIRSGKKSRRKKNIRLGARILSVLLAAVLILNTAVFAYADEPELPKISSWPVPLSENSERIVSENPLKAKAIGKNDPQGTRLTELVLTDLDEPEAEKPYDKTATVTSHEKISWDVPVYWIDSNGKPADQPTAGQECLPLIVFYVPDGYVSDGLLELTPYLSDVFRKAGGVLSVVDHALGVTYITAYVKDSDDPEPAVSKNRSAGKTDGRTGDRAEDNEPKGSFGTDASETPENAPSANEQEQSGHSGTADDPKEPETEQPADDPKEPEDDPPVDEPEEPDPYIVFAEKYREDEYRNIPWDEELEAFGGMDRIDLVRLVKTCGYIASSHFTSSISRTLEDWMKYRELNSAIKSARQEAARQLYDQADPYIRAHTSDVELVAGSDQENLCQFIHMLIDCIIPQATQLLRDNFPAFSAAADENFSRELGVDIILPQSEGSAYMETSFEYSDDYYIHFTVSIDSYRDLSSPESEYKFVLTEEGRNIPFLKQTILHELMHVFMSEYNRNSEMQFSKIRKTENGNLFIPGIGEFDPSDEAALYYTIADPSWFSEGVASLCGTPFAEYDWYISSMREDEEAPYTASGLYDFSQSRRITMDSTDSKYYWDDLYNSYIFGPLAVMYMGELYNRKTTGNSTVLTDGDGSVSVDTIAVRNGISAIMERMHNGETMDSVIADISDGKYRDTLELCKKYFEMDGPNMDSMGFAANVLNYVDALSKENGAPIPASILKPFNENILDLIDLTRPASTDIYVIQEGTGFVKSTVPNEIAFRTGTKSDPAEVLGIREEQGSNEALNGSGSVPAEKTEADSGSDTEDSCGEAPESTAADCDAASGEPVSEGAAPGEPASKDAAAAAPANEDAVPDTPVTEFAGTEEPAAEDAVPDAPVTEIAAADEPAAEDVVPDAPAAENSSSGETVYEAAGSEACEDLAAPSESAPAPYSEAA